MFNRSAGVTLSTGGTTTGEWLTLTQELNENNLQMGDIYNMWILAKSGKSARNYKPGLCDVSFTDTQIFFSVEFYVFPSDLSLNYELVATQGVIRTERVSVEQYRSFGIFFDNTASMDVDRILEDVTMEQEMPVFSSKGELLIDAQPVISRDRISYGQSVLTALRVDGTEKGFKHTVDFTLTTVDELGNNLQIDNVDCTITASWQGLNETLDVETLKLDMPKCVDYALNLCEKKPNQLCKKCHGSVANVYYSTCDGEVIDVTIDSLYEPGEDRWCVTI